MTITNIKTKHQKTEFFVEEEALKKRIAELQTFVLRHNVVEIDNMPGVRRFFERTYKKQFFLLNDDKTKIKLLVLPNGVRRNLQYTKASNNNALFEVVYEKISRDLHEEGKKNGFDISINSILQNHDGDIEMLLINAHDRSEEIEMFDDGHCYVRFDKRKWVYNIMSIESHRLIDLLNVVRRVFYRRTASTRQKRSKQSANRTQ